MWNRAAWASACFRNSSISSTTTSGLSSLRWLLRSAFSRCFCCRACSFWRLLNVDRPRGIAIPLDIFHSWQVGTQIRRYYNSTSVDRVVGARDRDNRRALRPHPGALRRVQTLVQGRCVGGRSSAWPR